MKTWIERQLHNAEMEIAFRAYRYGIDSASVKLLLKYRAVLQAVEKLFQGD